MTSGLFAGRDGNGKPVQISRTVRGGKKDAEKVALDPDTVALLEPLRAKREKYAPWLFSDTDEMPRPDRIGYWWRLP